MARILGVTLPATGHLLSQLPVLTELARRGHQVSCLSLPRYRDLILKAGVNYLALPVTEQEEAVFGDLADQPRGMQLLPLYARLLDWTVTILGRLQAIFPAPGSPVAPIGPEAPEMTLPDLILADAACPWSWRLARRLHRPCVTLVPSFAWSLPVMLSSPSALLDLRPQARHVPDLIRAQGRLSRYGGEGGRPPWAFLAPGGEQVLVLTSRAFQPWPWSVPRHWRFVGPTSALGDRPEGNGPTSSAAQIYVSLGTVADAQLPWWRRAAEALAPPPETAGLPVLLATGPKLRPEALGALPPNIRVTPWADQPDELRSAGVFVTHGGMNGVGEALRLGVPMVVSPQSMDHFWVASRLQRLGAAVNVGPHPTVRQLRWAVERVRGDGRYRKRAAALGATLWEAGGVEAVAEEVEALL